MSFLGLHDEACSPEQIQGRLSNLHATLISVLRRKKVVSDKQIMSLE